jgi:hypothetical protein
MGNDKYIVVEGYPGGMWVDVVAPAQEPAGGNAVTDIRMAEGSFTCSTETPKGKSHPTSFALITYDARDISTVADAEETVHLGSIDIVNGLLGVFVVPPKINDEHPLDEFVAKLTRQKGTNNIYTNTLHHCPLTLNSFVVDVDKTATKAEAYGVFNEKNECWKLWVDVC